MFNPAARLVAAGFINCKPLKSTIMPTQEQNGAANVVADTNYMPAVGLKPANFQVDGSGQASYIIRLMYLPELPGCSLNWLLITTTGSPTAYLVWAGA